MSEHITVSGIIGTIPRRSVSNSGVPITSFRLAARQSHFDRVKNVWVDDESSWYSVTSYRQLATNAAQSLNKGEHIVVTGRLVIRNWTKAERSGIDVEIIADTLGHDLTWYTTAAVRGIPARAGHDQSEMERGESPESAEAESVESAEAAAAYESSDRTTDHSGDGFVPVETDAEQDVFARLDS